MRHIFKTLATIIVMLAVGISCSSNAETSENQDSDGQQTSRGEHDRDSGERGEGEEDATEFALNETYDKVRNGARLILKYDAQSNSFNGTVENTTERTLKRVRVEVHQSNGKELGPTTPTDLEAGKKISVKLAAESTGFTGWTAHPEIGEGEHSGEGEHGEEGEGEHGREGRGEHERERRPE